jgi:hypothetical protein
MRTPEELAQLIDLAETYASPRLLRLPPLERRRLLVWAALALDRRQLLERPVQR